MPYISKRGLPKCSKSGIYSITNKVNGKVYVGSAACIRGRLLYHRSFLRRGKHDNPILQNSWNKHGEAAFRFDVLETCQPEVLLEREQHWIDTLETADRGKGYNIAVVAGSAMKGRHHTAEMRAKMSAERKGIIPVHLIKAAAEANRNRKYPSKSEETLARMRAAAKRRWANPEYRKKLKEAHWSNKPDALEIVARMADSLRGKVHTAEHNQKISEGNYRRWAKFRGETTDTDPSFSQE